MSRKEAKRPGQSFKDKAVETIAVYWEDKPKTYGFRELTDLSLLHIDIRPEKMSQWGLWLSELADNRNEFYLVLAKYSSHQKLSLYILAEKFWAERVLCYMDTHFNLESDKDIRLISPVELISFQGPHFGDRYGIAHTAFKALDDHGIPILITVCSGAAVYIVLPHKKVQKARSLLAEVFEAP